MLRNFLPSVGLAVVILFYASNLAIGTDTNAANNTDQTLAQLETRFFEHQYDTDTDQDRINRIEQFIFGCNQTGSVNDRIQHILSTIPDDTTDKVINVPSSTPDNNIADNQTTADTPTTTQSAKNDDQNNDQSTNETSDDKSNYSSYPRVTSLEQEILGHTYEADALPLRLARLETKAFGTISSNNDLGARVDNLDDYAQRHDLYGDRKIANSTNSSLAFVPPKNMRQPASAYPTDNTDSPTSSTKPQPVYTSKTGSFVGSMEERVAMMEAQEFDHTYPEKPLDKRLKKLEKKILPTQDNSQLGLFERTSKLWITLHPTDKGNIDNLIADNDTGNNGSIPSANSTTSNTANTPPTKHSSWLHKLANEVESTTTAPYSGYSNFSGAAGNPSYPYPGSFYVPQTASYPANSRFIGASFGPGAGPGGIPVGFW